MTESTTTERECLEALRAAASELGKSPTKAEYEELGLRPASATIIRVLGGWNEAKEGAGLETYPSRGSRIEPKPDSVDLPEGVGWEDLTVDQRWHYRNVETNRDRTLERRRNLREWVREDKRSSDGCARCGEDDPACLDFHHPSDVEKELSVTRMVSNGYSREKIRAEIRKCTLLCANCHRKAHADRSTTGSG